MVDDEFIMFRNMVIHHFAEKNEVAPSKVQLTYMHYENNRFKAGCLIKPTFDVDTLDVRLELN
ncbi:MAG: hypothetical protein LC650_05505 [Actinobacteria bacterium]|nr:hypothetical protein [Actinomycetota bacterium]